MSCVWCADEGLAVTLIKALSVPDVAEDILGKCLPDLYHCTECVNEYHRLKKRWVTSEEGIQSLLALDTLRLKDQLKKTRESQLNFTETDEMLLSNDSLSYMWRPVVEMLRYPYLLLNKDNMALFLEVLQWEIKNMGSNFIEPSVKYPGLFLLLVNSINHVQNWAKDLITSMEMISNETYHIFKPVLSSLLRIILTVADNEDVFFITETTVLPGHIYGYTKTTNLWIAYAVMFNSLQNRILKMLLSKNKEFFTKMMEIISENNDYFWSVLKVLQILLDKLGSGFWLITNTETETPMHLYNQITSNQNFKELKAKSFIVDFVDANDTVSKDELCDTTNVYETFDQLFMWFLPLLRSIVDFGQNHAIDCMLEFHLEILDTSKKRTMFYWLAAKSIFGITSFLLEINQNMLFSNYVTQISEMLVDVCKVGENINIEIHDSAVLLIKSLIGTHQACLSPDVQEKFASNFNDMVSKRRYDKNLIKNAIVDMLKTPIEVKSDPIDNKNDIMQQIKIREALGSAIAPIVIDDDDDDDDVNDGNFEGQLFYINSDEETEKGEEMVDDKSNINLLPAEFIGSLSPLRISDDEQDTSFQEKVIGVDFSVSTSLKEMEKDKKKAEIESTKTTTENMKVNVKTVKKFKLKLDKNLLHHHKTKHLLQKAVEEKESKNINKEEDIGVFKMNENVEPPKKQRKSSFPQRSTKLRRELIEKDLTNQAVRANVVSLPDMRVRMQYNLASFHQSILGWKADWLIKNNNEFDIKATLDAVPLSFETYDSYVKVFWPLMLLETWSQLKRDWEDLTHKTVPYVIDGIDERKSLGKICHIRCCYYEENPGKLKYDGCPSEDDLLFVEFDKSDDKQQAFAIVDRIEKIWVNNASKRYGLYTLSLKLSAIPNLQKNQYVSVTKITSLVTVFRQWNAIIGFQRSLLAKDILKPFREKTFKLNETKIEKTSRLNKLNQSQLQAVSTVCRAVLETEFPIPRIVMLQGPPGTGKSYTVKALITHLLQEFWKASEKTQPIRNNTRNRILVCAPSNAAVDEIAKRLYSSPPWRDDSNKTKNKNGNCGDFNLLRIGRRNQIDSDIYPASLEYLVQRKMDKIKSSHNKATLRKEMGQVSAMLEKVDDICVKLKMSIDATTKHEYINKMEERTKLQQKYDRLSRALEKASCRLDLPEEERKCEMNLLLQADVICCTLSGAGCKAMNRAFKNTSQIPFRCVIIDEAGQCSEPDALIPLQYGPSKLVLVGDPAQLPATVLSQRASRYNFGQSLFERLFNALVKCDKMHENDKPAIMLNVQYRMAPEICSFPSRRFYHNMLQPAKELTNEKVLSPLKQFVMLNLANSREKKSASGAIHNPCERDYIIAICQSILKANFTKSHAVAVITPYRQQVIFLKNEFKKHNLDNVTVNTIDGYQGQERDVVILSCVRGPNERNTIGFLKHPQRMNVALTRAKHSLIVLAHCDSLEVDEDWKALVDDARSRKLLFNIEREEEAVNCIFSEKQKHFDRETSDNDNKRGSDITQNAVKTSGVNCKILPPLSINSITESKMKEEKSINKVGAALLTDFAVLESSTSDQKKKQSASAVSEKVLTSQTVTESVKKTSSQSEIEVNRNCSKNKKQKCNTAMDRSKVMLEENKRNISKMEQSCNKEEMITKKTKKQEDSEIQRGESQIQIATTESAVKKEKCNKAHEDKISQPNKPKKRKRSNSDERGTKVAAKENGNDQTKQQQLEKIQVPLSIKLLQRELAAAKHPLYEEKLRSVISGLQHLVKLKHNDNLTASPAHKTVPDTATTQLMSKTVKAEDAPKTPLTVLSPCSAISNESGCPRGDGSQKKIFTVKLPHRHHDGFKCVERCRRSESIDTPTVCSPSSISSDSSDHIRFPETHPYEDGTKSAQLKNRRDVPSSAYFKFPHRHHDGTYCEHECKRVVERERKKKLLNAQSQSQNQSCITITKPWRLEKLIIQQNSYKNVLIPSNDPRIAYLSKSTSAIAQTKSSIVVKGQSAETTSPPLPLSAAEEALPPEPEDPIEKPFPDQRPPLNVDPKTQDPRLRKNYIVRNPEEPMELSPVLNTPIAVNIPTKDNVSGPSSPNCFSNERALFDSLIHTIRKQVGLGESQEVIDAIYTQGLLQGLVDGQKVSGMNSEADLNSVLSLLKLQILNTTAQSSQAVIKARSIGFEQVKSFQATQPVQNTIPNPSCESLVQPCANMIDEAKKSNGKDIYCDQPFYRPEKVSIQQQHSYWDSYEPIRPAFSFEDMDNSGNLYFNAEPHIATDETTERTRTEYSPRCNDNYKHFKNLPSVPKGVVNKKGLPQGVTTIIDQMEGNFRGRDHRNRRFNRTSKRTGPIGVGFLTSNISKRDVKNQGTYGQRTDQDGYSNENRLADPSIYQDRHDVQRGFSNTSRRKRPMTKRRGIDAAKNDSRESFPHEKRRRRYFSASPPRTSRDKGNGNKKDYARRHNHKKNSSSDSNRTSSREKEPENKLMLKHELANKTPLKDEPMDGTQIVSTISVLNPELPRQRKVKQSSCSDESREEGLVVVITSSDSDNDGKIRTLGRLPKQNKAKTDLSSPLPTVKRQVKLVKTSKENIWSKSKSDIQITVPITSFCDKNLDGQGRT
ncbi:uncharacterized protein LOC130656324 [Hydractinia symbiolongicarpus]|uniref:uncharacterized protein LOC130656324 n=1 Tax=Hydractinia symbiolongicarpus TaxID=13093 RepID=UPI00254AC7F2|nr:uncharacterized protein LOC130656324 [Hydractinia symbiolongicarpus]